MFLKRISFWYRYGAAPREWFSAGYPLQLDTGKGLKTVRVELDEIRSAECPKSVLLRDPRAAELVQIFAQMDAVGESPLGTASSWPGALYDAIGVLKSAKARDENAQSLAIHRFQTSQT